MTVGAGSVAVTVTTGVAASPAAPQPVSEASKVAARRYGAFTGKLLRGMSSSRQKTAGTFHELPRRPGILLIGRVLRLKHKATVPVLGSAPMSTNDGPKLRDELRNHSPSRAGRRSLLPDRPLHFGGKRSHQRRGQVR